MVAYGFLEQERARLQQEHGCHVTIAQVAQEVQNIHWSHLLSWMHEQFTDHRVPTSDVRTFLLI